jgi:hypothetical protein
MSQENVEVVRRVWDLWESGPDQGDPTGPWKHNLTETAMYLTPEEALEAAGLRE